MKTLPYKEMSRSERLKLVRDYLKLFENDIKDSTDKDGKTIPGLQTRWEEWVRDYADGKGLPKKVACLLVADFERLAEVYDKFVALNIPERVVVNGKSVKNPVLDELEDIFKYTKGYDGKIAQFFIDRAERLGIKTCYYCEMAYVNIYSYWDSGANVTRRQFDLDHFLPKGLCPCLGLSLFNFVPSCQVCNSRIKLEEVPGKDKAEYVRFSPSSVNADFDTNVKVRLRFGTNKDGLRGRYIHFVTNSPYEKYVNFFHLEERYEFHKVEAVRLNRLKKRYPDANIRSIAHLLHYRPSLVKEDIFHLKYMQKEGRCFEKMTRDILK